MAWLEYGGRLRKLPDGAVIVGSGSDATLCVDDADLRPRHFVVVPEADHVAVSAFSPEVVVVVDDRQVGTEPTPAPYGTPVRAGSAQFRVWRDQPSQQDSAPATLTARAVAYLVDDAARTAYPLDRTSTGIGRASSNFIRLSDPTASRFHAQVRREAGGFALHVIGSAGGSLNGRRMAGPRLLGEGDLIEMAFATYRFTHGPIGGDYRIIPPPTPNSPLTERPTMAAERISLGTAGEGTQPAILRTALVIGVIVLVAAVVIAALTLR